MPVEFWIVIGISVAVFVLGSIFRAGQEERRREAARPIRRSGESQPGPPRTDLDRFLQEVQSRRQAAEERTRQADDENPDRSAERRDSTPPLEVAPRPVPPPRPPRRRLQRPLLAPPPLRPPPAAPAELEIVDAIPVPAEKAPPPAAVAPLPAVPAAPPPPPLPAPKIVGERTVSPALAQLAVLLQSPQSLRTGIILREILEPPLCRRGR
jgi:hypothetical protein